jgi:hypothetical protein
LVECIDDLDNYFPLFALSKPPIINTLPASVPFQFFKIMTEKSPRATPTVDLFSASAMRKRAHPD